MRACFDRISIRRFIHARYSSTYVEQQFRAFFQSCGYEPSIFLPWIDDELVYADTRRVIQTKPSAKQMETTQRARRVNVPERDGATAKVLTRSIKLDRTKDDQRNVEKMIIHCRHEQRLQSLKRDMHHIFQQVFDGTSIMDVKFIVGHRINRDLSRELINTRPPMHLLKNTNTNTETTAHHRHA